MVAPRFRVVEVRPPRPMMPAAHKEAFVAVEGAPVVVPTSVLLPAPVVPSPARLVSAKAVTHAVRAPETFEAPSIGEIPAAEGAVTPWANAPEAPAKAGPTPAGTEPERAPPVESGPTSSPLLPTKVLVSAARRPPVVPEPRGPSRKAVVAGKRTGVAA